MTNFTEARMGLGLLALAVVAVLVLIVFVTMFSGRKDE